MTLSTSSWKTLHTEYKQRKPVHSSVFQFNFKTLIRANLAASYPLYTALEVIGGSTPYFFSFVTLINKTTLTILIFTARIATQTNAMTQQITVHDVRAVFHKGNVSLLKSLTVLYLSLLFEAFICRTYRKLIKVALQQMIRLFFSRKAFFDPPIPRRAYLSAAWVAVLHQPLLILIPEAARLKCIYVLSRALGIFIGPLKFQFSQ